MFLTLFNDIFLPAIILGVLGGVLGIAIAILSKVFAVKEDLRVKKVAEMLPGYNCGACGLPGCNSMAKKIVEENFSATACKPIKSEKVNEIKRFLKEYDEINNNKN